MLINRDYYLNQIINSMWDGQIKVITGLRRVGKSVLFIRFIQRNISQIKKLKKNKLLHYL